MIKLEIADAFEWLAAQPAESMDLIITDPPYESLERHRSHGTTTRLKRSKASSNPWFEVVSNSQLGPLVTLLARVLRPDRHLYLFSDSPTMFVVRPLLDAAGLTFHKPLVWDKVHIGMGYHYRNRHEYVLFCSKGKRRLRDLGVADILVSRRVCDGYPTEKPVELLEILVQQSSQPGELVCDPFFGSGSVAVAAQRHDRSFVGCDKSPDALSHAMARLT